MKRTDSYVFTAHTASAGDMLEIETIRKTVKAINKQTKNAERWHNNHPMNDDLATFPRYRVSLKPRGPRTKNAIADGRHPRAYDQSLPLRHAERLDVYIHRIYTW